MEDHQRRLGKTRELLGRSSPPGGTDPFEPIGEELMHTRCVSIGRLNLYRSFAHPSKSTISDRAECHRRSYRTARLSMSLDKSRGRPPSTRLLRRCRRALVVLAWR